MRCMGLSILGWQAMGKELESKEIATPEQVSDSSAKSLSNQAVDLLRDRSSKPDPKISETTNSALPKFDIDFSHDKAPAEKNSDHQVQKNPSAKFEDDLKARADLVSKDAGEMRNFLKGL